MLRSSTPAVRRHNGGFALIVVLWTLVLIAFIGVHLTATGRIEIRIASNIVENAIAQAAADGAIFDAIFNLSDPQSEQRWPVNGNVRDLVIGDSRVRVRLEDEAWWINPNSASPALIEAMMRSADSDGESARRLAIAIGEWVGSAPAPRPPDVLLVDYRAAGLDYGPPGAPLETLDELGRVLGMTSATLAAIRPHLTLFGPSQPSPTTTDPFVATALASVASTEPGVSANQPPPDVLTTRITAIASGPNSAQVTRSAIVRFGAALPLGYQVLAWRDGF